MFNTTSTLATVVEAVPPPETEVVEIPLLLTGPQIAALETAAHARGLTAAELLRRVLRRFFDSLPNSTGAIAPSFTGR